MPTLIGAVEGKQRRRSRITSGARLLPGIHGQSVWARIMGDTLDDVLTHCGGADHVSPLQRMVARRIGALEAELVHLEEKFARTRASAEEPTAADLDLYSRLTNTHRRQCEALGWERTAKDITPDVTAYGRSFEEAEES